MVYSRRYPRRRRRYRRSYRRPRTRRYFRRRKHYRRTGNVGRVVSRSSRRALARASKVIPGYPQKITVVNTYTRTHCNWSADCTTMQEVLCIRANSVYDPNKGLTGGVTWDDQASLHTYLSGVYGDYRVLSSVIEVKVWPHMAVPVDDVALKVMVGTCPVYPHNILSWLQLKNDLHWTTRTLYFRNQYCDFKPFTIERRYYPMRQNALADIKNTSSLTNTNPQHDDYFYVLVQTADLATLMAGTGAHLNFEFTVYYRTEYFDRKNINQLSGIQQQ